MYRWVIINVTKNVHVVVKVGNIIHQVESLKYNKQSPGYFYSI